MKILFFGSDYYSTVSLRRLIKSGAEVVGVITTPTPGKLPFPYPDVSTIANSAGIPAHLIHEKADLMKITENNLPAADIGLVVSFGYLIPQSIFSLPRLGTYNIHPSLLPQYRGATPVQSAMLDQQSKTGVSIIKIDEKFDTGDIIYQSARNIPSDHTAHQLLVELITDATLAFMETVQDIKNLSSLHAPQNNLEALNTTKISTEDTFLDLNHLDDISAFRKIKAYYSYPVAWTTLGQLINKYSTGDLNPQLRNSDANVKIFQAHLIKGNLAPDIVQIEGKKPMSWSRFKNGYLNQVNHLK
jgi:methionyl-tRNA formyltransferase